MSVLVWIQTVCITEKKNLEEQQHMPKIMQNFQSCIELGRLVVLWAQSLLWHVKA